MKLLNYGRVGIFVDFATSAAPTSVKIFANTVDGRNPAPPGMYRTLKIMG